MEARLPWERASILARPGFTPTTVPSFRTSATSVRIESLSMTNERCLYDFLYVAPPATFEATRGDFAQLVDSFGTESP